MKWTQNEMNKLIEEYPSKISLKDLGLKLGKTVKAVKHKAARLGLSRPHVPVNKPLKKNYRKNVEKKYYEENKEKIYLSKRKRIRERKQYLINLLGGKCSKCGYKKCVAALEFHHKGIDKEGHISHIIQDYSKEKALKEVKKCILLCANCHREVHN